MRGGLSLPKGRQAGVATSNLTSIGSPVDTMEITPNYIG